MGYDMAAERRRKREKKHRSLRLTPPGDTREGVSPWMLLFTAVFVVVAIWWKIDNYAVPDLEQSEPSKTPHELQENWVTAVAMTAIQDNLKAPASAEFFTSLPPTSIYDKKTDTWAVYGNVDSQNGFGAMVRSAYYVSLSPHDTCDNWGNLACWDIKVEIK